MSIVVTEYNVDELLNEICRDEFDPNFIVVDLFCGAGGTTTGIEMATINGQKIAKVIACVNHDALAIKSHWQNHPEVFHFEEDIRTLKLSPLIRIVKHYRRLYPKAKLVLWASLECTNFSKAKGGQPRDADSRTLANHLERYITAINPDYIQIENVVEFMSWGPMDPNGKPVSRKNGQDWIRWRNNICKLGYRDEWKELNSANFGAYTSRNRLFGIFARHDLPIIWPEATHAKSPCKGSMFASDLKKWKAVKDVLDFTDEGLSIFNRKKPLSDKTLDRIYAGLVKYVAKGDTAFLSKYFSGRPKGKVNSVDVPGPTVTTFGGTALVQAEFLACYYGNGDNISGIDQPSPTLVTKDRISLIKAEYFIDKHYGTSQNQSIDAPAGTIMPNDKHRLVEVDPFIMPTNYDNIPKSIDEPCSTITANRKHHYLVNPSWSGNLGNIEDPCCVVVARQDKVPIQLIQVEDGEVAVPVYEDDSESMVRVKKFMAAYGLCDIKMRMLRVPELLKIQGFPEQYKLAGNQADQKKFIGNSVAPIVVKAWYESMANHILNLKIYNHDHRPTT